MPGNKRKKNEFKRFFKMITLTAASVFLFTVFQVLSLRFVNPPFTFSTTFDRVAHVYNGETWHKPDWQWKPLGKISGHLKKAVLAAEDQRFLTHHGFDFIELEIVFKDFFSSGKTRGASTITMQTARTLFLLPSRSVIRKLLEAYYTVLIELLWNKKRTLEVYLNTVDWGKYIMGAEAASQTYFKKSAGTLTREQAALMAAILPSPRKWSPVKPDNHVQWRQKRIMEDMDKMPDL